MAGTDIVAHARGMLYAAVLSDTLDSLGYRDQAMKPGIRPLDDGLVLCGRARTARYVEVDGVADGENPYELEIALIDDLKPDEVAVLACGGSDRIAPWGELLSTASRARRAAGCVTDGFVRDVTRIREMRFPTFHGGIAPLDSRGRGKVAAIDVPVVCGGVRVQSGDLIFGDVDGVVVIPEALIDEAVNRALAKVEGEDTTRAELAEGRLLAEVFAKYGVL